MVNSLSFEMRLVQRLVRNVAICLEPQQLSDSILSKLASRKSDEFIFIKERDEAHVVVSNIESVRQEVVEADEKEYISVAVFKENEDLILASLEHHFSLD